MTKKEILADFYGKVGDKISPDVFADFSDQMLAASDFNPDDYVPKSEYDNLLAQHKTLAENFKKRYLSETLGVAVAGGEKQEVVGDKVDDEEETEETEVIETEDDNDETLPDLVK